MAGSTGSAVAIDWRGAVAGWAAGKALDYIYDKLTRDTEKEKLKDAEDALRDAADRETDANKKEVFKSAADALRDQRNQLDAQREQEHRIKQFEYIHERYQERWNKDREFRVHEINKGEAIDREQRMQRHKEYNGGVMYA